MVRLDPCDWCGYRDYADSDPPRRDFYFTNEAWHFGTGPGQPYAFWREERIVAEVMFGWNCPSGGTLGEMAIRWYQQGSSSDPSSQASPRLEVFCDAWVILARFRDVIEALAERDSLKTRHNLTPQEFCELLKSHGFVDATTRQRPSAPDDPRGDIVPLEVIREPGE